MTRFFSVTTCCWLVVVSMVQADGLSIPEYRHGDTATIDVVAPFEFAVVNPIQTERLRQQELENLPAVYRFNPWVAVQAEEKFSAAYSKTRTAFLDAMEIAARMRQLDEATVAHPSFWRFVDWFKAQHPHFPLTTNLAKLWALGESNDTVQFHFQSVLREIMGRHIRPDRLPFGADTPELQIVAVDTPTSPLTIEDASARGELVPRPRVWTLSEARQELARRMGEDAGDVAKFLGSFLSDNLAFDDWLTNQKRQQRAAELIVFDQYSAGQLVVRTGQIVDARAKAALDVLVAAVKRQQNRVSVPTVSRLDQLDDRLLALWGDLQRTGSQHPWLIFIVGALAIVVLWRLVTSRTPSPAGPTCEAYSVIMNPARNETVFLPVHSQIAGIPMNPPGAPIVQGGSINSQWQMQLCEAEQRAEELLALVRAGLAPHLAKELTHKLVQELVCQRATLLRAHQMAEQQIAAIEVQFEKVRRDLQERISAYEKRTSDLEKELITKADQTRELMKATILLTQQKLEEKKAGGEFACN